MGQASAAKASSEHPARGGHRAVHRRSLRAVPSGPGVGHVTPGYRIWLHVDGVRMFGPGTHELLRHVEDSGSLHRAAKAMGMSYTKAWTLLRKTEEHLGWPLVERHIGGAAGGGTSLTARGRDLLERFEKFMVETDAAMLDAFDAAFGDWPSSQPDQTTEPGP
jgi:molybdate transport system regulatory protein